MNVPVLCTDCGCDRLVWKWSDGDVICTNCGLVVEERFIDDRVPIGDIHNYYMESDTTTEKEEIEKIKEYTQTFGNILTDNVAHKVKSTIKDMTSDDKKIRKCDIGAGIYVNSNGVTASQICESLNIKSRTFWKSSISQGKKQSIDDILKRIIHSCEYIPADKAWDVIKISKRFLEVLESNETIQACKPNKIAITLMIIACEVLKLDIDREIICREYKISKVTLLKNEKIIQNTLKNK
jgi:transcription initiation factor TFIIIB Brf1 subunit/transcription initiation factor TFIIB